MWIVHIYLFNIPLALLYDLMAGLLDATGIENLARLARSGATLLSICRPPRLLRHRGR